MSKSNLPPGVTDRMIPGNRPEDGLYEKEYDRVYSDINEALTSVDLGEQITKTDLAEITIDVLNEMLNQGDDLEDREQMTNFLRNSLRSNEIYDNNRTSFRIKFSRNWYIVQVLPVK